MVVGSRLRSQINSRQCCVQVRIMSTSIVSHGEINSHPDEIYGTGPALLRIGNGGAGATGLVGALAHSYLKAQPSSASIEWICNHSRNTQLALLHGHVDIGLTYERSQEEIAEREGWSKTRGCAFHDHFVLAGPPSDPANVRNATSVCDALKMIAEAKCLFHSRADFSATMAKERALWTSAGLAPWESGEAWYQMSLQTPAAAILAASTAGSYLLTDRATLLCQTWQRKIPDRSITVFFEPESSSSVLMNSCFVVMKAKNDFEKGKQIDDFVQWLLSDDGQEVIAHFGRDELGGYALFAAMSNGFAETRLEGGIPLMGNWVH